MLTNRHSAGEWVAERHGATEQFTISQKETKHIGAIAEKVWGSGNAALIVASPVMLDALQQIASAAFKLRVPSSHRSKTMSKEQIVRVIADLAGKAIAKATEELK